MAKGGGDIWKWFRDKTVEEFMAVDKSMSKSEAYRLANAMADLKYGRSKPVGIKKHRKKQRKAQQQPKPKTYAKIDIEKLKASFLPTSGEGEI